MATIQTALQLYDGISGPMRAISNAVNIVINTFGSMQDASAKGIDVVALQAAREGLAKANVAAEELGNNLKKAEQNQQQFNDKIRRGESAALGLGGKIKQFVGTYAGIQGIKLGVQFVTDTISLQNIQSEAETKLGTIMRQRMGADPAAIQSIKDLASAQQGLGVVGDEVQLSGAQQLATFLNSTDALNSLIPAMNNLAVQQNGVNVSTGDMVNIGNMMGKVMQGQVGALTRVGVTFTEAQEKVLKYGTEQERAATLAQVITDNVGNMNAVMANTPQGQIQQMANTWGDIKEVVGAKLYPAVMQFFDTINSHMPRAETFVMGLAGALNVVIAALSWLIDGAGAVAGFFQDNWGIIAPIILGVAAGVAVYALTTNAATIASNLAKGATSLWTKAQGALNAVLSMNPIALVIIGIIALIAIIYAVVGAINKFKNTSISAAGIIAGAFAVLGAHVINTFVIPAWNMIASFINFFYNVWNDPIAAVKVLFLDLADSVIGYVSNMAHAIENIINRIPGVHVDITGGLDNFKQRIEDASAKVKSESEWKEIVQKKEFIDYGDAAQAGYQFGQKAEDKVKGAFGGMKDFFNGDAAGIWDSIGQNTEDTAGNTAKMGDSMNMAEENLKYMRDLAEQETINRFTTAEIKVDMVNNNSVSSSMDLDGIVSYLVTGVQTSMEQAAEGVHT